jgi:hypothetical protein
MPIPKYSANIGQLSTSISAVDLTAAFGAGSEFALVIPNQGTPNISWVTSFAGGSPGSITVLLEGSLDGLTWFTVDTSSSITGELRNITGTYRFLRINNSAVTVGAGITLTASFVYSNTIRDVVEDREISGVIETAEMNNLFSVPKVVIPDSLGAGVWLLPYRVTWRKEAGTAYTLNGSAGLQLYSGVPQTNILARIVGAGLLDQNTLTRGCIFNLPASTTATVFSQFATNFGFTFGTGLQWGCPTANFSGGVGRLFYKIRYFVEQDGN